MQPAAPETSPENKAVRPRVPGARNVPKKKRRGLPSGFASIRDLLSFFAGVSIIAHEVWWAEPVDVAILAVGVTLAGLPVVFGADEKNASSGGGGAAP